MTVHHTRVIALAAVLVGITALVPLEACTGAQETAAVPPALVEGEAARETVPDLRARAEQGDAEAQFNLGVMYSNGEGVPQDDAEAVRLYRLAADQGNASVVSKN